MNWETYYREQKLKGNIQKTNKSKGMCFRIGCSYNKNDNCFAHRQIVINEFGMCDLYTVHNGFGCEDCHECNERSRVN